MKEISYMPYKKLNLEVDGKNIFEDLISSGGQTIRVQDAKIYRDNPVQKMVKKEKVVHQ